MVIDASGVGRLFGTGPAVPLVVDYGASPITQNFTGTMTFFNLARTVTLTDKNKSDPQGIELLKTSPRSFTVPNLKTKEVRYDPAKDTAGPLSLGVAAERNSGGGDSSKHARLVVIGNSAFATNQWAGLQRNGDLFVNTVNWLAQDEDLISVRPKNPASRRVILTEAQQRELFFGEPDLSSWPRGYFRRPHLVAAPLITLAKNYETKHRNRLRGGLGLGCLRLFLRNEA